LAEGIPIMNNEKNVEVNSTTPSKNKGKKSDTMPEEIESEDSELGNSTSINDSIKPEPDQAPSDKNVSSSDTQKTEEETNNEENGPEDQNAKLIEEAHHYKDRWVRLAAEFDNYKKRTNREFGNLIKNAGESLITELLPILDNIERALQAPQTSDETRSFAQGFEMISQQFQEKLGKVGMKEIKADGEIFDPTQHEAVMAIENAEQPADTIVNVVEKGYTLNDKVLRPAKVIVARPPAKTPE
tara:strand:- start:173820 stop:174545 length:726 start_codon:yes stop_codon:yes gene_type:complete